MSILKTMKSYSAEEDEDKEIPELLNDGVFDSINLALYSYAGNNPIILFDILGLYWLYAQATGKLYYVDDKTGKQTYIGRGYSGKGEGLNNPKMQHVEDVGPIPQGEWTIGEATSKKGPLTLPLTAAEGTETFGRTGLLIHGDNRFMNYTASKGCIIMPKSIREQINKSEDKKLKVVEDVK